MPLDNNQKNFIWSVPTIVGAAISGAINFHESPLLFLVGITFIAAGIVLGATFFFRNLGLFIKNFLIVSMCVGLIFLGLLKFELEESVWGKSLSVSVILMAWSLLLFRFFRNVNVAFLKNLTTRKTHSLGPWAALPTDREQGTDSLEIELQGKSIKRLFFSVQTASNYWNAGFKICDANQPDVPLRTDDSILFHVGAREKNGHIQLSVYVNGLDKIHKNLLIINKDQPITVSMEVSEKNWFKCLINGNSEFEDRIDPKVLKKAFLQAWGDGYPYSVTFDNIAYELR